MLTRFQLTFAISLFAQVLSIWIICEQLTLNNEFRYKELVVPGGMIAQVFLAKMKGRVDNDI